MVEIMQKEATDCVIMGIDIHGLAAGVGLEMV